MNGDALYAGRPGPGHDVRNICLDLAKGGVAQDRGKCEAQRHAQCAARQQFQICHVSPVALKRTGHGSRNRRNQD